MPSRNPVGTVFLPERTGDTEGWGSRFPFNFKRTREEQPIASKTRSHTEGAVTKLTRDAKRARLQGEKRPAEMTTFRAESCGAAAHHPTKIPKQDVKAEDEPMELSRIKHSY